MHGTARCLVPSAVIHLDELQRKQDPTELAGPRGGGFPSRREASRVTCQLPAAISKCSLAVQHVVRPLCAPPPVTRSRMAGLASVCAMSCPNKQTVVCSSYPEQRCPR